MITNLFQYAFVVRGFEAGLIMAVIAPLVGMFLVLRRYALMADTLSHVSLAGVAIGLLLGFNPLLTALCVSGASAMAMETLRTKRRAYGDTALSLFLSGSLALAIVLIGLGRGFTVNLFSYLFGSILTVSATDVQVMGVLGIFVVACIGYFYKEFIYISFDEEAARVSGLPVQKLNLFFVTLAAIAIALSIPIVGILLVSALMVIPVVAALQLKKSFTATLAWAEFFSLVGMTIGMIASFYLNIPSGGTIVLVLLAMFILILLGKQIFHTQASRVLSSQSTSPRG